MMYTVNGIPILYIQGSYYEMGCHHGEQLKSQIHENTRAFLHFSNQTGISVNDLIQQWYVMKKYIPKEYIDELQGIANGSNLPFHELAAANMVSVRMAQLSQCSVFIAWGPATRNNDLIHVKSFDYPFIIQDPKTKKYIQENQVLLVRQPTNGFTSTSPSFAGFYGNAGINDKGIGIGILFSYSHDQSYQGTPERIKIQMVLDQAHTLKDAVDIIKSNPTMGYNYLVSDGNTQTGVVIEQTNHNTYIGTWDNLIESNKPFWQIDHVIRRTNCFLEENLAKTQRKYYNPKNPLVLCRGEYIYYPNWRLYRALSKGIEQLWGAIDVQNVFPKLQEIYHGQTDRVLWLINTCYPFRKLAQKKGFLQPLCIFSASPKKGEFSISFATNKKRACDLQAKQFNLFSLQEKMSTK